FRRYTADLLRAHTEAVEIVRLPPEQWKARFALLKARFPDSRDNDSILATLMLSSIERTLESELAARALLRAAFTAVAAERFRLTNNTWPATLDDLVTARLIPAVPIDRFDGKPLRLAKRLSGVTVYSLGPDLTDNDGTIDPKGKNAPRSDIGFRLYEPAARRMSVEPLPEPRD